jgi:hypothetical protein
VKNKNELVRIHPNITHHCLTQKQVEALFGGISDKQKMQYVITLNGVNLNGRKEKIKRKREEVANA